MNFQDAIFVERRVNQRPQTLMTSLSKINKQYLQLLFIYLGLAVLSLHLFR